MKQITFITILLIAIPFFIVTFLIVDNKIINENDSKIYVRVKRDDTQKIDKVELEEYVVGVVAGEMPVSFHMEALKAQAVAARSYVLTRIGNNKKNYDVVDTTINQVYLDNDYLKRSWKDKYSTNITKITMAVISTKGEYIEYKGKVADALFFSTSNGFTENSEEIFGLEVPYLRSVDSIWDKTTSPVFNDQKKYSLEEFYQLLNLQLNNNLDIKILKKTSTGRILELEINGHKMTGSEVVSKLKLRSNDFVIELKDMEITIDTKGFGHGVGMSQYGALGMAEEGYSYDEILKHYYKGIEIGTL